MKYFTFFGGFLLFLTLWYLTSKSDYEIENDFVSHAYLTAKSPTIESKLLHMNLLIEGIDECHLSGHNAFWFKTPNNSYDSNYMVLKNYQNRLLESRYMDVTSFEYQAAITHLENCNVHESLSVIKSIWYKEHYQLLWDWVGVCFWLFSLVLIIWGVILWISFWDDGYW